MTPVHAKCRRSYSKLAHSLFQDNHHLLVNLLRVLTKPVLSLRQPRLDDLIREVLRAHEHCDHAVTDTAEAMVTGFTDHADDRDVADVVDGAAIAVADDLGDVSYQQ
jgi:hypothetical protein